MQLHRTASVGVASQARAPVLAASCHATSAHSVVRASRIDGANAASPAIMAPATASSVTPRPAGTRRRAMAPIRASATDATPATATPLVRGAHWEVHKYGGTCMATAERIRAVSQLMLQDKPESRVVVVSAMGSAPGQPIKVTDLILNMIKKAAAKDAAFLVDLAMLHEKHIETATALLGEGSPEYAAFMATLSEDITNLKAMLKAISIAGMATDAFSDFVVGHGELWSAQLMAACMTQLGADVRFMDTRDVLVVTPTSDGSSVDLDEAASNAKLDAWFQAHGKHKVIVATGFIAKNPQGQATTLRRNGSDLSATIMGALFRSGHITIWTDVDGVYSADPRKVPEAVCLNSLTYHEAWELSYFGANVLHPRTTLPAMKHNIPITIRNFFNLQAPGTVVASTNGENGGKHRITVKGFATIDNVTLINVEGTGMVGVPGIASAIFSTVRDANVNVIMISQASSEHSVCFAVKGADSETAAKALRQRFKDAIGAGRVQDVKVVDRCCVLACVGEGMVGTKGVAATMAGALAKANVNIKAMAQGSSEYNITVLIDQADSERALRAVHSRFYLSDVPMGIGIVGPGLIGGTLIKQLKEQSEQLKTQFGIDMRVLGIATSSKMLLSESGIDLDSWKETFDARAVPCDLAAFGKHLSSSYIPNTAIVDCTASDAPASHYLGWMQQGNHIITPNKKLGSGPLAQYTAVRQLQRESYIHFFYEGTVGAGLPIIGTLKHLMETGDKIIRVEGIFSGTLSYIFNTFGDGRSFSDIVKEAKAKGYTEPDPRDDLSGTDVARKVAILARETGMALELSDIPVDSLVPKPLQSVASSEEYMAQLPNYDGEMAAKLKEAEDSGECLRYVGVVDCKSGKGTVELRRYPKSHPFAQLQGTDNIIAFTTQRYLNNPLIVRGPGAGADVTAGGVFSDLLRLAAYLGAPS